jgi:hypothetical protein
MGIFVEQDKKLFHPSLERIFIAILICFLNLF